VVVVVVGRQNSALIAVVKTTAGLVFLAAIPTDRIMITTKMATLTMKVANSYCYHHLS